MTGAERDLRVPVDNRLNMSQQRALAAMRANCIFGCNKYGIASQSKEVILPLCLVLVQPHCEYCVQLWTPQHKKVVKIPKRIQMIATN